MSLMRSNEEAPETARTHPPAPMKRRRWRSPLGYGLLILALAMVLAAGTALHRAVPASAAPVPAQAPTVRSKLELLELSPAGELHMVGWAFAADRARQLVLRLDGKVVPVAPPMLDRPDVVAAFPSFAAARTAGFDFRYSEPRLVSEGAVLTLELPDAGADGAPVVIAQRLVGPANAMTRWAAALHQRGTDPDDVFYVPIATSGVAGGGAEGIRERFGPFESATMKVGIRVQILYLRTTLGQDGDYVFDPAFRTDNKRCAKWPIAEDSLDEVMRYAVQNRMPVLFTLNGGIWADSNCDVPAWDINDRLEQDPALCQWNQNNQVMPDDYLTGQAGSYASPQLARSLSLNVYAARARHYKKRNLQQAATLIAAFARRHPDLFIGIDLDHDVYVNPFFGGEQWYDYNPDTLRQFRQWLQGVGPYGRDAAGTDMDLTRYARALPLSLAEVNRLAKANWVQWSEVDPPRAFKKGSSAYRDDPWFAVWEQFRRQLVAAHYDDLSMWVAQAGIPPSRIYTGEGFQAPGPKADPLALRIDSPPKDFDTGGVSVAGAMPVAGRLGAILYGASARNRIRMEGDLSLFAEFRKVGGENWAAVEFNTADLDKPKSQATFERGYEALRELGNYGARLVSPMAWNGSPGDPSAPNFVAYTALRDTPLASAIAQFMLQRANLPRSARLWEFGAPGHFDTDGWKTRGPSPGTARAGTLQLIADSDGVATMESPSELRWMPGEFDRLVVGAGGDQPGLTLALQVLRRDGRQWETWMPQTPVRDLGSGPAGWVLPLGCRSADASASVAEIDRFRLVWHGVAGSRISVDRVALYPSPRHALASSAASIPPSSGTAVALPCGPDSDLTGSLH